MRGFARYIAGAVLLIAATPLAEAQNTPQLLQTHLDLDLTLEYDAGTIAGSATVTLKNIGSGEVGIIPVQLGRLMLICEVMDSHGDSVPFTQDVVTYEDWPQLQVLQAYMAPTAPLPPNETWTFRIGYAGTLVGYTETGMSYVRDRIDREFTIIRTDARAFPVVSEPSIASLRSQPRADFTFGARITVPVGLTVATGRPESERLVRSDQVTWVFSGSDAVPFLNITVAPYETLDRGGMRVHYFPEDSVGAQMVMGAMERGTDLYTRWFGPLDSDATIHVNEIPEGWGSQASLTGGIIQTADAFRDEARLTALYHELSHLWNVADLDQPSCRWNEGLAMFLQQRVAAESNQVDDLAAYMAEVAASRRESLKETPELARVPFGEYGQNNMTDYSYTTGQLMFYVLYRVMGEAQFDAALKGFIQTYRSTGSTTDQFAAYMRQASSGAVDRVLHEWLNTTGWARRLQSGETLEVMISSYSQ